ncbi:MAG: FAD:protein FMN transferase [Ghiorsea sp.]
MQQTKDIKETRFLLGTIVDITVYSNNEEMALHAIQQATLAMTAVEQSFTTYGETSNTVKLFNLAPAGIDVELNASVDRLLEQSLVIHKQTFGAFDPTLGELNQRWGFSSTYKPKTPLSDHIIMESLQKSGVENLQRTKPLTWHKNKEGLKLDFGAIAKGLAIDEGVKKLESMGVEHAIINAGGDIRVLGDHGGKPWRIAVRHPREQKPLGWFEVNQDLSIVTSGDYERFFLYEGKRYHHIIDPNTGKPSATSLSVTVIAPTATQADALSTAMFILGYKQGIQVIEGLDGVEAIWVAFDQSVHMSSGMKMMFHSKAVKVHKH